MRKILYTLNIGDYAPDIRALTYPLMRRYANKIGAEFCEITESKFPEWPVTYEKIQLHWLSKGADWVIYADADTLISPDFFDVTHHLPRDTVATFGKDMAGNRFRYDQYFERDGRHIGIPNWFAVVSSLCLDYWHPLVDLTKEQAIASIHPIMDEVRHGIYPAHLIDDYVVSRNVARYGLKHTTIEEVCSRIGFPRDLMFVWHRYTATQEEKLQDMRAVLKRWGIGP